MFWRNGLRKDHSTNTKNFQMENDPHKTFTGSQAFRLNRCSFNFLNTWWWKLYTRVIHNNTFFANSPPCLSMFFMWKVIMGLKNRTSQLGFSLTYRLVLYDHVPCQIMFLSRFLLQFLTIYCGASWRMIWDILVVATGRYYNPVIATGGSSW